MITLSSKIYTADAIHRCQIHGSTTKANMLKFCKKFDLYVSPNLKKNETACRIANGVIDNPIEIISRLSKAELQILDELVKGDDSTYVVRKERKTPYIHQKYYMVVIYCDDEKEEWHMLMPTELRKALSDDYKSISRPCSARQERTIGKIPENDGVYEEFVWGINILMKNKYTKSLTCNHCAPKGQLFHSPGHRPGYKVFTYNAPCKGNFKMQLKFAILSREEKYN